MLKRRIEHLRTRWDSLRKSLWFVPTLMAVVAAVLAVASSRIDRWFNEDPPQSLPWFVYVRPPDQAQDLLSTLLASMMTMASLVFSITIVVLTLAASQFGPRLIRSFMASLQTQVALGTFVMTIVYCLLATSLLRGQEGGGPSPSLSVTIAVLLALASVCLLVLYIDMLARSIVSETVIERVGRELDAMLEELEPDPTAEADPASLIPQDIGSRGVFFGAAGSGYVQAIEIEAIVSAAADADVTVFVYFRAGDFVVRGGSGIAAYPAARASPELIQAVQEALVLGDHRTSVQDLGYAIRHLVEIAVRALSPGVNDPYTALAVINRLSASLSILMGRRPPRSVIHDGTGGVRLVLPGQTYASIFGAAFDQIRQNGGDKPVIAIHLLEAIARLAPHAVTPEQRSGLEAHRRGFLAMAERRVEDPSDLSEIKRRATEAERALAIADGE